MQTLAGITCMQSVLRIAFQGTGAGMYPSMHWAEETIVHHMVNMFYYHTITFTPIDLNVFRKVEQMHTHSERTQQKNTYVALLRLQTTLQFSMMTKKKGERKLNK